MLLPVIEINVYVVVAHAEFLSDYHGIALGTVKSLDRPLSRKMNFAVAIVQLAGIIEESMTRAHTVAEARTVQASVGKTFGPRLMPLPVHKLKPSPDTGLEARNRIGVVLRGRTVQIEARYLNGILVKLFGNKVQTYCQRIPVEWEKLTGAVHKPAV